MTSTVIAQVAYVQAYSLIKAHDTRPVIVGRYVILATENVGRQNNVKMTTDVVGQQWRA